MVHALDEAYLRIDRAREHLADLETRIDTLRKSEEDDFFPDFDSNTKQLTVRASATPTPPIFSILIGEVLYNLHAALDYLVYALAFWDSRGVEQSGTQFPIEDTPKGFEGRTKSYLKGVDSSHVTNIKSLQPCDGCDWTRRLRDLSNPDKHRHLSRTIRDEVSKVIIRAREPSLLGEAVSGKVYRTKAPNGSPLNMHVDFQVSFEVTFDDGAPVVETLKILESQVAQTLDAFKLAFE